MVNQFLWPLKICEFRQEVKRLISSSQVCRNLNIRVDPLYSEKLTHRYNEAKKHRKQLRIDNPNMAYFVDYPVRVLGKPLGQMKNIN